MDLSQEKPPKRNPIKNPGQKGKDDQGKDIVKATNETTPRPSRKAKKHPAISYKLSSSETDSDDDAFVKPPPRKKRLVPAEKRAGPSFERESEEKEEVPRRRKTSPTVPEERQQTFSENDSFVVGSLRREAPHNQGNSSFVSGQQLSTSRSTSGNIKNPLKRSGETITRGQDGNGKKTYTAHYGHEDTAKAFGRFQEYITSLNLPLPQNSYASETGDNAGGQMEDNSTPHPEGGEEAFTDGQEAVPQNAQPGQRQEQGEDAGTGATDKPEFKRNEDGLNIADSEEHLIPTSRRRRNARRRILSSDSDSDDKAFPKTLSKRDGPSFSPSESSEHSGEDVVTTRQRSRKSVVEAKTDSPFPSSSDTSDCTDSSESTESSFLEYSDSSKDTDDDDFVCTPPRTRKAVSARKKAVPVPKQVAVKRKLFPTGKDKEATPNEAGLVSRPTGRGVEDEFDEIDNVAGDKRTKSKIIVPSIKGVKIDLASVNLNPHYRLLLEIEKRTTPLSEEGLKEFAESCKTTGMNPINLWWKTIKGKGSNPTRQQYVLRKGEKGDHQLITTYVKKQIAQIMNGVGKARGQIRLENPEKRRRINELKRNLSAQEEYKFHKALRREELKSFVVYQIVCIEEDEILDMLPSAVLERMKAGLVPNYKIYTGEWGCTYKQICYRNTHANDPASVVRIAATQGHRVFQLGVWEFKTKAEAEKMESLLMINETAHSETTKQTIVLNRVPGVPISAELISKAITLGRQGIRMISFTDPILDEQRADPFQLRYPMQDEQFIEITDKLRKHQLEIPTPSLTLTAEDCHVYVAVCVKQEDFPNNVSTAEFQDLLEAGLHIPLYLYAGYTAEKHHNGVRQGHSWDRVSTLFQFASEGGKVFSIASFPCSSIQKGRSLEVAVITVIHSYAETHPTIISLNKKWGDGRTVLPNTDIFLEASTIGSTGPALFQWSSEFTLSNSLELPWKVKLVEITETFKCDN